MNSAFSSSPGYTRLRPPSKINNYPPHVQTALRVSEVLSHTLSPTAHSAKPYFREDDVENQRSAVSFTGVSVGNPETP